MHSATILPGLGQAPSYHPLLVIYTAITGWLPLNHQPPSSSESGQPLHLPLRVCALVDTAAPIRSGGHVPP